VVLAVNGYDESKAVVEKFVQGKGLQQKVLLQGGRVARGAYGVRGYPTRFFIDRAGTVVGRDAGFTRDKARSIEARIQELLLERR
jgi:hypothetical protein